MIPRTVQRTYRMVQSVQIILLKLVIRIIDQMLAAKILQGKPLCLDLDMSGISRIVLIDPFLPTPPKLINTLNSSGFLVDNAITKLCLVYEHPFFPVKAMHR